MNLLRSVFLALLAGCQSAPTSAPRDEYVLVFLKSGANQSLSTVESQKVFEGHFANMKRLSNERKLLIAGPFSKPKRDPDLRGLFVIDAIALNEAEELSATDPAVVARVMRTECHPIRTDAPLRAYLEHELALTEQDAQAGRVRAPGEGGRTYVLLTAEDGERARHELASMIESGNVLLWAALDGSRGLALIDAKDLASCEELLGDRRARLGPHVLDPWFGSGELVKLPTMNR